MEWRHILSADQFDLDSIKHLFDLAKNIEQRPNLFKKEAKGKVMIKLFYQPSTRTSLSFELAMGNLGGRVVGTENARIFSSATKGETLEDTILTITDGLRANVIVLRYDKVGGAKRAAQVTRTPIINAGDGKGEHPTQALLDLFTIQEKLGRLNDFKIAMIGDLYHSRTVHSLSKLLTLYTGVEIIFVSSPEIKLDKETEKYLQEHQLKFSYSENIEETLKEVDVAYVTRIQEEYYEDPEIYKKVFGRYVLSPKLLPEGSLPIIMHPLPRNGEITFEVDKDPRAIYFQQVNYGLHIRMALLYLILNGY